jgi:hypothetical protein
MNDSQLLELAFEALIPFANMSVITDEIKPEDLRQAREVLRLLSSRIPAKAF